MNQERQYYPDQLQVRLDRVVLVMVMVTVTMVNVVVAPPIIRCHTLHLLAEWLILVGHFGFCQSEPSTKHTITENIIYITRANQSSIVYSIKIQYSFESSKAKPSKLGSLSKFKNSIGFTYTDSYHNHTCHISFLCLVFDHLFKCFWYDFWFVLVLVVWIWFCRTMEYKKKNNKEKQKEQ